MCTADSGLSDGKAPATPAEALRSVSALLDYIGSSVRDGDGHLAGAESGELLIRVGEVQAKLTAVHTAVLRGFDTAGAHDADGYGSSSAWLAARAGMSKEGAKAAVRQMHLLTRRPHLENALAAGEITDSLASAIVNWTKKLPADRHRTTDKILLDAARSGASPDELTVIAGRAYERWRQQQPDADDPSPDDRFLSLGTTFGGAGVIRGDLTPECQAAVRAVLEALGKRRGPEDDRSEKQRFHDALQEACTLLLGARLVPDRAGAATQAIVHISLGQLRQLPGAEEAEQEWLRARLGCDGSDTSLSGTDAETAACDAQIVPVVTGQMDLDVVDKIIALARAAAEAEANARATAEAEAGAATEAGADTGDARATADAADVGDAGDAGTRAATNTQGAAESGAERGTGAGFEEAGPGSRDRAAGTVARPPGSSDARQALRYAIARLAAELMSGPWGLAAALRRGTLAKPWNSPSLPLDIGYSTSIPGQIRRAVQLRDRHCAWPRCDRSPVQCDVHHLRHQSAGGETSVANCVLLCQFHHDVLIHRRGWQLALNPDGTTTARSPDGRTVLHSHAPPAQHAA